MDVIDEKGRPAERGPGRGRVTLSRGRGEARGDVGGGGKSKVSALASRTCRLRFVMRKVDLPSYLSQGRVEAGRQRVSERGGALRRRKSRRAGYGSARLGRGLSDSPEGAAGAQPDEAVR